MRPIIALVVLLACAAASAGEVYKWKDKDGRVHYGDKPKHGVAEAISTESSTAGPSENEAARLAREKECQTKKAALENYRKAPSLSEIDNLGKQREYSPAERAQFLDIKQKEVDGLCAPPPPTESAGTFPPEAPAESPAEPPTEPPAEAPPAE